MDIIIRPAVFEDIKNIMKLHTELSSDDTPEMYESFILEFLRDGFLIVAEHESEIIGWIIAEKSVFGIATLINWTIKPEFDNENIKHKLFSFLFEYAKSKKCISIHYYAFNEKAVDTALENGLEIQDTNITKLRKALV